MKGNCNAESVFYVQQDAQYELMLWPVLFQIIACSMNCGIGRWINAVTEMKAAMTIRTMKNKMADDKFALFWKYITTLAENNLVNDPVRTATAAAFTGTI